MKFVGQWCKMGRMTKTGSEDTSNNSNNKSNGNEWVKFENKKKKEMGKKYKQILLLFRRRIKLRCLATKTASSWFQFYNEISSLFHLFSFEIYFSSIFFVRFFFLFSSYFCLYLWYFFVRCSLVSFLQCLSHELLPLSEMNFQYLVCVNLVGGRR